MNEREQHLVVDLLTNQRIASLAVEVDERPFVSLVPFAAAADFDTFLIHASALATHSRGLTAGARYALLIHQPDTRTDSNPAQLARITLQGRVEPLGRSADSYGAAKDLYLAKFPQSEITFQLGDFTLYALTVESCRLVAGLARTFDLTPADLAELS